MNYSKILFRLFRLSFLTLILSACQSAPPVTRTPDSSQQPADATDSITSALPDTQPSGTPSYPIGIPLTDVGDDIRLQQAASLFETGNPGLAIDMLDSIDDSSLTTDQRTRKQIMQATILMQAGGSRQALQILKEQAQSYQTTTLAAFYLVRAQASLAEGDTAYALSSLIKRGQFLTSNESIENQLLLWNILMIADTNQLQMIQQTDLSAELELAGWLELASMIRKSSPYPGVQQSVNNWRISHFSHPATPEVLDLIIKESETARKPERIAFLLPLTSSYEPAASAIRDGFEAMNNEQAASSRYLVRYYDYGRDVNSAVLYYNQAINEGADIIIGPLGRQSIDSLLSSTEITVPTILLSPPGDEQTSTQQNLYQFSLSQELEAQQSAQRAWLDGYRRGAVMYPESPIGQRMAAAFTESFNQLGGVIVSDVSYSTEETDYSPAVSQLLGVERSEQRIAEMKKLLGGKITTEARRRQDIDFIFLAASNGNARLIKPVLDFFYALDLPIYSTSLIFSGKPDPINDADLERISFPDMPWMIASNVELESLRTFLQGGWPGWDTSYNRLYGLGMDIFSILPRLERMRNNPDLYYRGLSGSLSIDENGIINRQMLWAKFQMGKPVLLDIQSTYQGRFSEKKFEATPPIAPGTGQ